MNRKALPIFAILITLIGITANSSEAQSRRKITLGASVPFEFIVANRAFPAGHYVFELATGQPKMSDQSGVLVVRGNERKLDAAVATGVTADARAYASPKLMFVHSGDRMSLSTLWRPGDSAGLSVHPAAGGTDVEDWQESQVPTLDAMIVTGGV